MTEERFGEIMGSLGWALVADATPDEREEFLSRWDEARRIMPIAVTAAENCQLARPQIKDLLDEARATFGIEAKRQLAQKLL